MDDNKNAQEAVEETGKKAPATSDSPAAGPHAKPELMDEQDAWYGLVAGYG